jgi:clan AA aspartic protease
VNIFFPDEHVVNVTFDISAWWRPERTGGACNSTSSGEEINLSIFKFCLMGVVYAEIELINSVDQENARRHIIGQEEIRSMRVTMLVDCGAWMLCINENIQSVLQLPFIEQRTYHLATSVTATHDVVGPVEVRFANRRAFCSALVLPGDSEPLLGAIPMEEMDVLIHPKRQELIINPKHPDGAILKMGGMGLGLRRLYPE